MLLIHRLRLLLGRRRFGGNLRQRVELAEHVVILQHAQIFNRFEILLLVALVADSPPLFASGILPIHTLSASNMAMAKARRGCSESQPNQRVRGSSAMRACKRVSKPSDGSTAGSASSAPHSFLNFQHAAWHALQAARCSSTS